MQKSQLKSVAKVTGRQKQAKKQAIRKPESKLQVLYYRLTLRELRRANKIDKSNQINNCVSPVLAINHLVWEHLEKLYLENNEQFQKHIEGEPFELLTNSIQLTTRIFYTPLFIEDALDPDHPVFASYRSLWYKSIRPFLLDINYILKITNYRAGNYSTPCDEGRGNFSLRINIRDFLFGVNYQFQTGNAASDDSFCPENELENFYSYAQNTIQSEIELRKKEESQKSGEASPQSSCSRLDEKNLKELAKQVENPSEPQKNKKEIVGEIAPNVENLTAPELTNYATKLSKLFVSTVAKKEFLNHGQIRVGKEKSIDSLITRDYTADFCQLIKLCRQSDELNYTPVFLRIKKIILDKVEWLRKDRSRWIYTPDQYLSTEKYKGSDDFIMKSGCLRAYHDDYTVHVRERITPSVSNDLEDFLDTYYPTLKQFGVSDKFLKDWTEKIGKENLLNEVRRCFARLAQGFKPLSKAEYVRRAIRNCYIQLVKEKADLQVKKAQISSQSQKPLQTFKPSESQVKNWLKEQFGDDALLFGSIQIYSLRTNATSPDTLRAEALRLLKNIKQAKAEESIYELILHQNPAVADDIKQAHRFQKNISLKDFTKDYLKKNYPQYFTL